MAVAILGISLIGAAYALWYEDLTLTATVSTGTFDVDWSCENPGLTGDAPANCNGSAVAFVIVSPGQTQQVLTGSDIPPGKGPVCTAGISDNPGAANDVSNNNQLTLTVTGLYPFSGCDFYYNIHSVGTVPAHLSTTSEQVLCTGGNPCSNGSATTFNGITGEWGGNAPSDTPYTGGVQCSDLIVPSPLPTLPCTPAGRACYDLMNTLTGDIGVQLHQSYELRCHLRFLLGQFGDAEGDTITFTIIIKSHQWNENP